MTILWWHWIVLGLILALAELAAAGGFYIIFFGLAAIIIGLLSSVGLAGPTWLQLLLFSVMSVGLLLLFRTRLLRWLQVEPQKPQVDALVGEVGILEEDLTPNGVGRFELRGTTWSARNDAGTTLGRGTRCRVIRVQGLMLHIVPEGAV